MRPPTSIQQSKNRFRNLIIAIGLFSGILITTLIWLKVPNQITTSLSWFSLGLIGLGSFWHLRQPAAPRLRWITILAVLAAISLVYLFPEMFHPVCGGMPRAFASPSTRCGICLDHVCDWSNKTHSYHCYCDEWDNSGCTPTDPPSIDAELNCSLWGNGSWCAGSYTLDLSAAEPQGLEVMISGDVNGTAFACPASLATSTCSVPLPEGSGSASFTATSASGLTTSDSSSYQHDSVQPQIDGWLNGTNGNNDWFISSVDINASASDPAPASGIATFEYNLDNGGWESFPGSLSLSDGVHSLSLRASDAAGNTVETDQTVQIDTITPALDMSVDGTLGANGWYSSAVQVSVSASDSGSGVNTVEYDLDGAGWTAYSGPLDLSDGVHNLSLRVIDNAGNITEGTQIFSVDTLAPVIDFSLTGTEGANGWYTSTVQVNASASDAGSGLSTMEVSVDGGAWSAYSMPLVFDDGPHTYQFRATDQAGNLTNTTLQQIQVDTIPPAIDLPKSWKLGQTTTFKLQDDGSGLASVRLVIEDEDERYPKVTWDESLGSYKFKGEIDWDGHFKDGQLAPPGGEYYAWLKVRDHAGNESMRAGQITVPVGNFVGELILPSDDRPTGLVSGAETSDPVVEPPVPLSLAANEAPASQSPTVSAPPTISFGGAGNGAAQPSSAQAGKVGFNAGGVSNSPLTNSPSNILWGATATAAIGAFAAEITRRKEAEQAAQRAANAAKNQRRKQIAAAYQASVTNFKAALNQARRLGLSEEDAAKLKDDIAKTGKIGAALGAAKDFVTQTVAGINAAKQFDRITRMEEKLEAGAQAYGDLPRKYGDYNDLQQEAYDAYRAQEVAAQTKINSPKEEKTWWDNTKAFVKDKIIQPTNAYVYQPYINPAFAKTADALTIGSSWVNSNVYRPYIKPTLEKTKQAIISNIAWVNENIYQPYVKPVIEKTIQTVSNGISWANKNIYQPYVKPAVEKTIQVATDGIAWANENIYQPYIKPVIEKTIQAVSDGIAWVNENIYQPYVQPVLASINEKFYQPYVKPLLDKTKDAVALGASWIDKNIYQPYFEPVVTDIDQYIYRPYFKPLEDQATDWWDDTWDEYGEWVHGALDTVGFVPGLGDIADGLNGLIYLGEGRYLEATVSALAMIPLIGDLGKGGKWGLKLGKEALEEAVEVVVKEGAEEVLEVAIKEGAEEIVEVAVKEGTEEVLEVAAKEGAEEVLEVAVKESAEEAFEVAAREGTDEVIEAVTEKTVKEVGEEITEKIAKEVTEESAQKALREVSEEVIEKSAKEIAEETTEKSIRDTGEQILEKNHKRCLGECFEKNYRTGRGKVFISIQGSDCTNQRFW